jgi:hypothetical protein
VEFVGLLNVVWCYLILLEFALVSGCLLMVQMASGLFVLDLQLPTVAAAAAAAAAAGLLCHHLLPLLLLQLPLVCC